jgi:hypothetical protein
MDNHIFTYFYNQKVNQMIGWPVRASFVEYLYLKLTLFILQRTFDLPKTLFASRT